MLLLLCWNNLCYVQTSNIVLVLVIKLLYTFILTSLLDFLSKYDYFHTHMDFVILYGSTEWYDTETCICDWGQKYYREIYNS